MSNPAVADLHQLNAVRMTATRMYVHAFPLRLIPEGELQNVLDKFEAQRRLRLAQNDLLKNDGKFIIQHERGLLITGCNLSASIMRNLLKIPPKQVSHPIV